MGWQVSAEALLIDLDGTLVDSHASIMAAWTGWSRRYGVDPVLVNSIMPGRSATSVMREVRPDLPEQVLAREQAALLAAEIADAGRVTAMPGARDLLAALPADRWAIVTACTEELAGARLLAAGLPAPAVLIGSDTVLDDGTVPASKPDPAGYLAAAARLGTEPGRAVVLEDAPAGVAAGRAAGMRVIALPPAAYEPSASDFTALALDDLRVTRKVQTIAIESVR